MGLRDRKLNYRMVSSSGAFIFSFWGFVYRGLKFNLVFFWLGYLIFLGFYVYVCKMRSRIIFILGGGYED